MLGNGFLYYIQGKLYFNAFFKKKKKKNFYGKRFL